MSASSESSTAAETARADADRFPCRILLVEDSEEGRAWTLALLRRPGSAIELAEHAAAALERLEREPFDLILLDMQLPVIDGYETARRIRALEAQRARSRAPIIALGAEASREQVVCSLDAGCDAHVTKPVDEHALLEAIRSCTEALDVESVPELVDLLPDYLAHRRADVEALCKALSDGNWALVRRLGHDMKGSGKIYGLPRISAIGARIESSGTASDRREASLALAALESFLARAAREMLNPAAASGPQALNAPRLPSD